MVCSTKCASIYKKNKGIKKVSEKRKIENKVYLDLRKIYLNKPENKICPITGEKTTEIHHKKGRIGDLLNDTRFWMAVSRKGHQIIENNPEWAKKYGYSLNRINNE